MVENEGKGALIAMAPWAGSDADLGGVFFQILNLGPGGKREQNGTNKQQIKQLLQYRSPSFNQRFRYD